MIHANQTVNMNIVDCLSDITNQQVTHVYFIGGGGNNQIYHFMSNNNEKLLAKFYYHHVTDMRHRALTEYTAMRYLWRNGMRCIPEPLYHDDKMRCVIYEYVEGNCLNNDEITNQHINQTIGFLLKLREFSRQQDSYVFNPASESCFSVGDLVACIKTRIEKLDQSILDSQDKSRIGIFVNDKFKPVFEEYVDSFCEEPDNNTCIPWQHYTLSPSDVGFHNTIRKDNNDLVFVDFEYFGWDDSAKMFADYLLHPAMNLSYEHKSYFINHLLSKWPKGNEIAIRLPQTYILTALKWCLLFLNEFVPTQLNKRILASNKKIDPEVIKQNQLEKAEKMLMHATQSINRFPIDICF